MAKNQITIMKAVKKEESKRGRGGLEKQGIVERKKIENMTIKQLLRQIKNKKGSGTYSLLFPVSL